MSSGRTERYASAQTAYQIDVPFFEKLGNLKAALTLHFSHYNFCRVHGWLRVTPATAAGITNRVWEIADLLAVQLRLCNSTSGWSQVQTCPIRPQQQLASAPTMHHNITLQAINALLLARGCVSRWIR